MINKSDSIEWQYNYIGAVTTELVVLCCLSHLLFVVSKKYRSTFNQEKFLFYEAFVHNQSNNQT